MEAGPVIKKGDMKSSKWIAAYENNNVDVGLACGFAGVAQIGKGMSVWAVTESVSDVYIDFAREMLQALGLEILVDDEKYIDMATALSGSGPAYVFMFLEAMIDAGVYIGLSRDISSKLAIQTVLGLSLIHI